MSIVNKAISDMHWKFLELETLESMILADKSVKRQFTCQTKHKVCSHFQSRRLKHFCNNIPSKNVSMNLDHKSVICGDLP